MSNQRAGDHAAREGASGGLTWVECSCGWVSAAQLDAVKARAAWAVHEQEGQFRCRCTWNGGRCPNQATQEDAFCDWCGARRPEDLRDNPKAMWAPDGEFLGLGGAGELHVDPNVTPDACWMPNSGRTMADA